MKFPARVTLPDGAENPEFFHKLPEPGDAYRDGNDTLYTIATVERLESPDGVTHYSVTATIQNAEDELVQRLKDQFPEMSGPRHAVLELARAIDALGNLAPLSPRESR